MSVTHLGEGVHLEGARRPRFKPLNAARAKDYKVQRVAHAVAAEFIRQHHYAKGCANTSTETFGLFKGDALVGAALWMPPTKVAAQSVDPFDWERVVALSRLAVAPTEQTNTESLFIGSMLRTLNEERRWTCAVTYADESQGHEGTIYKATAWQYVGRSKTAEPRWEDADGKQVSRKATKTRNTEEMKRLGYQMVGKFKKHKFVRIFDVGVAWCLVRMGEVIRERGCT